MSFAMFTDKKKELVGSFRLDSTDEFESSSHFLTTRHHPGSVKKVEGLGKSDKGKQPGMALSMAEGNYS